MRKWLFAAVVAGTLLVLVSVKNSNSPETEFVSLDSPMPQHAADDRSVRRTHTLHAVTTEPDVPATAQDMIRVHWYDHPTKDFVFPTGSTMENYQYFRSLAESGNGIAAHQLANMMLGCRLSSFRTQEQLEIATRQMRETFTYVDPTSKDLVHVSEPENIDLLIEIYVREYEKCTGFTAAQLQEYEMWLEISADDGYSVGMLDYGNQLKDPKKAVELFRGAWLQGDFHALQTLAKGLQDLYDEGVDPSANVPAYAAMHAFVTLYGARYGANAENIVGRATPGYQSELNEMGRKLKPNEIDTAVEQSRELITSNENCCYSF